MAKLLPDPKKGRPSKASTIRFVIAIVVILVIGAYIAVVTLNEGLRRDYFWQRFTLIVLTLGIVVVIFTLFKNLATLDLPGPLATSVPQPAQMAIKLAGPAAFFAIVAWLIFYLMFPKDQTVWGYIYYEKPPAKRSFRPVKDVVVVVPETDQRSQPTGDEGRFVITNLSGIPKSLDALYADESIPFKPADYIDNRYPIIPAPVVQPATQRYSIAASEWTESGNRCPNIDTTGYRRVAFYVLQKSFPASPGFENLVVKVAAQNGSEIVDAQKEKPDDEGFEDQLQDARTLTRQWSMPAKADRVEVKLALCLGRKKPGPPPVRNDISTQHWLEH